jgi:hypothetical protein
MELDSDIVINCDLKLIGNKGVWNMSRICKVMGVGIWRTSRGGGFDPRYIWGVETRSGVWGVRGVWWRLGLAKTNQAGTVDPTSPTRY